MRLTSRGKRTLEQVKSEWAVAKAADLQVIKGNHYGKDTDGARVQPHRRAR